MGCQYMLGFANLNKIDLIKGETFIHAVSEIVLKATVICIIEFEFYLKRKNSFHLPSNLIYFFVQRNKRDENKSEARPLFIFVSLYLNKVDCFQIYIKTPITREKKRWSIQYIGAKSICIDPLYPLLTHRKYIKTRLN